MKDTTEYANSVFEQPWWLNIVAANEWDEIVLKDNDEIIARLPYVERNKHIIMPPHTQTLGPWMKKDYREYKSGNTQLSKQKEIVTELMSKLPKYKSFKVTFDSVNDYILPYRWLGYSYTPYFSYRIPNLLDLDEVYGNFNKTVKKNIKYARNKTNICFDSAPDELMFLLKKTYENQNRKIPGDEQKQLQIMEESIKRKNGLLIIAKDTKGNLHSGAFLLYDTKVCFYLFGGSDPEFRNSGAQSLVLWEAIQYASKVSKEFDFEGSNIEGIENFFRQFGGTRVINYSVRKLPFYMEMIEYAKPRIKNIIGYKK